MIESRDFVAALKAKGFNFFTGVPCSFFKFAINAVIDDSSLQYVIVPNEGAGLAAAAGAALSRRLPVVMIQNSGFGNLINPLTSLNMIYRIPVLILMSGRAYGVPDEPQHEIIGKSMGGMLDAMGVRYADLPQEIGTFNSALEEALAWMKTKQEPFVFFVKKGTLSPYDLPPAERSCYPLKRIEAIRLIAEAVRPEDYVIATTGKPSRELFSVGDRKRNFYMQGSMGHAASIGLGVALSRPGEKVVVLDGDGAILMHLGVLSSIGHYRPKNLYHIVLDNESYETTGDQDTTSRSTDLCAVAAACGYRWSHQAALAGELQSVLLLFFGQEGPAFLRVKINRESTRDIPRITTKYTSPEIAVNFSKELIKDPS